MLFSASQKNKALLGGKGTGLATMKAIDLPVPDGFTIVTSVCQDMNGKEWPAGLQQQVDQALAALEQKTNKRLGDANAPLLVSVRSGAAQSMPGMMDTVLNLGLNPEVCEGLARLTGNRRFALDSYRRFICMFGNVVMGMSHGDFEKVLTAVKKEAGVQFDNELSEAQLEDLIARFKTVYQTANNEAFPTDAKVQLYRAITAVFESWNNPRAISYRRIQNITGLLGTAVNVQMMVFGNMGDSSATGVGFTRDPSTGAKEAYGEFLINAQGEDVVAGIRTPIPIADMATQLPESHAQLMAVFAKLENHFKDVQDLEFTIENGQLYMLQTRNAKRTGLAAVRTAVEMVNEGLITKEMAVARVDPNTLTQLLLPRIDPVAVENTPQLCKGLPASPGGGVGKIAFTAQEAMERTKAGEKIILCREETCPDDIEGMNICAGICTARGGMTSHAAVVCRGMGKACVCGVGEMHIDEETRTIRVGDRVFRDNDTLSIDGSSGKVFEGSIAIVPAEMGGQFGEFMSWADEIRTLGVRANAETEKDARKARELGAEGIGLARTEHMFFKGERILAIREMILSKTVEGRKTALAKLLPFQKDDFKTLFDVMRGLSVNIRLLDPPLHEFLPTTDKDMQIMSEQMDIPVSEIRVLVDSMHETNPMLGFRGCRLGVVYPEISEMQVRAIFGAACELVTEKPGPNVQVEVMIPVLAHQKEMAILRELVVRTAEEILTANNCADKVNYTVGVMMELPRACLMADKIAEHAQFFSFGTNDLTQTTLGYSRDDAGKFIPRYIEQGVYEVDPFQVLDQAGVGQLIETSVRKGRSTRPDLKIGICGEHGGEPSSIDFCHRAGLNYVSCSPFRVPVARLAAAQAALRNRA
eukprot:gnl/Trimastix_PCT/134.p2 GENE.gnl/Trimastix_PCT/134~~gnl/Trimastix_PCT/134.p2  ORF type:complete len:870 (+),score=381.09 gnl/Trimastix_PCT/134:88-2697(+)